MRRLQIFWVVMLLMGSAKLTAQTTFYEETPNLKGTVAICAYESATLFGLPGRAGDALGTVLFGEELVHLGREATVKGEGPAYLLVKTSGGLQGWVRSSTIVSEAGLVVVLEKAPIYGRPSTLAAATNDVFEAGEIAILSDFRDNWVQLISEGKSKMGWVRGYDILSVNRNDIEIASNIRLALNRPDPSNQRQELRKITSSRSEISPQMRSIVDQRIRMTYGEPAEPTYASQQRPDYGSTTDNYPPDQFFPNGEDDFADDLSIESLNVQRAPDYNPVYRPEIGAYQEQEVVDMTTGQTFMRVRQTGTIQAVKAKNPKTIYYAYHKSLPVGTQILLEIPSHPGKFVPLTVVAALRDDNPNLIGLGAEVIRKVYGVDQAAEVPFATIVYRRM